jgi:glyoxylase I family protein
MGIDVTGYHHIRLTVRDLERSRAFYDAVFGLPVLIELPPDADEATRERFSFLFGGVIYRLGDGMFGLRPVAPAEDRFDEDRVGLDHISLRVDSVQQLDDAVAVLHELGVDHAGIKDIGPASILEFRDPDGIALELYAPNG